MTYSPPYSIGVNNDDGDCYDIVIKQGDKPIAALIATEGEVHPPTMLAALKAAEEAIEVATNDMFSGEDGKPLKRLKPTDIENIYLTLCGVIVQVHEAVNAGASI